MFLRQLVQLPLHVERTDRLAVFQSDDPALGGSRETSRVPDRISQNVRQKALLEEREDARGRPDLQRGCKRTHVRVADKQMEPAIFPVISQRLIARVDDRAVELHPLVNVVDDMIGPLAELEIDLFLRCGSSKSKASGFAWPTRPAPVKIWRVARKASSGPAAG